MGGVQSGRFSQCACLFEGALSDGVKIRPCFLIETDGRLYRRERGGQRFPYGPGPEWKPCAAPKGLTMLEWLEILREVEAEFSAVPMILDRALHGGPPVCATAAATAAATSAATDGGWRLNWSKAERVDLGDCE